MAEFWSNNDRGYRIRLWIDQTSQNIAGNSSQVRVRLALLNTTTTFSEYSCSAYVDLNGQRLSWSGSPSMLSYNQTIMLIDKTITVGHNADGTKSFSFTASFSGSGGWSPGTLSIGGNTFRLTTIPRATTPTLSNSNPVMGQAITISLPRASDSFTHYVYHDFLVGSWTKINDTPVGTSLNWTLPLEEYALRLANATSGNGRIKVDTYNGGTYIGSKIVNFFASVPDSAKPTFSSVTLTDTNTAAGSLLSGNNFLQIISNIQVTFNGAVGSYGSSITGYRAEIVNRNQATNSNGGSLGIMNFNGSATIRASVVDTRGRWSDTKDVTINVIEYFAPILNFTALRTRETPSIIQIVRNAKIAPITLSDSQKNVMTLEFKVAPLGSTTYTADTGPASGSWTTIASLDNSPANLAGNYLENKSFTIVGTLSDKFISVEFSTTISTESVVMSYDKDGRMAICKIADTTLPVGSFEAVGNIYASDMFIEGKALRDIFYPVDSPNGLSVIGPLDVGGDINIAGNMTWRTDSSISSHKVVFDGGYNNRYDATNNSDAKALSLGNLVGVKYLQLYICVYQRLHIVNLDISNIFSAFATNWPYSTVCNIPERVVLSPGKWRDWNIEILCKGARDASQLRWGVMYFKQEGSAGYVNADTANMQNTFVYKIVAIY